MKFEIEVGEYYFWVKLTEVYLLNGYQFDDVSIIKAFKGDIEIKSQDVPEKVLADLEQACSDYLQEIMNQ